MFEKLSAKKDRKPAPALPPPLPDDESAVGDAVFVMDTPDEPELSEPITTEIVEEHDDDPEDFGPVAVEAPTAPDESLTLRAQRIAAEIEEMMATAQADAVAAATAPLETTIRQLHTDLDEVHGDRARLRHENQELRARLAQIHAASA